MRLHTRTRTLVVGDVDCTTAIKHTAEMAVPQELTESGAIAADKHVIKLTHASVVIAATIADMATHGPGLVVIKDTTTGATHTVTLTTGTFDGTNDVATFNAADETLVIQVDEDGNGIIVSNLGAVALSTA